MLGLLIHRVFHVIAQRRAIRLGDQQRHTLLTRTEGPLMTSVPLLFLLGIFPGLPLSRAVEGGLRHFLTVCLIAAMAWLVIALLGCLEAVITWTGQPNDLESRRIRTQVQLLHRVGVSLIVATALALILMTFPAIWSVGASILASAGVAGVVVGIAARPALANILAGLQVALTEPIRIDDVVIVEGEWGRIEEVNTTFVVVRIWDLRRLVVPLTYFIEKPFQNWTRTTTNLIGTVFLHVDYRFPVDVLRPELHRILSSTPLWDERTCIVQVTEAKEHTMELRIQVSAANAPQLWELRCLTREALVKFLQENYPDCLPRYRAEIATGK